MPLSVMTRSTGDAVGGEEADRSTEERHAGRTLLVVEDLDVGEPRGVVDGDVDELPADPVGAGAIAATPRAPGGSVTGEVEAAELLDVDVDELARVASAVAVR